MNPPDSGTIIEHLDECRPEREIGFVSGLPVIAAGDRLMLRGWALARDGSHFTLAAEFGDNRTAIVFDEFRRDVAQMHPRANPRCGFQANIALSATVAAYSVTMRLSVTRGDATTPIGAERTFVVAVHPARGESLTVNGGASAVGRIRSLSNADPRPLISGWPSRRSVRRDIAVVVRGWLLDPDHRPPAEIYLLIEGDGGTYRFATVRTSDGEATAFAGAERWFDAGFCAVIAPFDLKPGLYTVTAVAVDAEGAHHRGPSDAFQILEDVHRTMPRFVTVGGSIGGSENASVGPDTVVKGDPVLVRGPAIDPTNGEPAAVFVRFDDGHPLRIEPVIGDPRRFAGLADTAGLTAGEHRLQVLLEPLYFGFWHLVAERTITVLARRPSVAADGKEMIENRQAVERAQLL